MNDRFEPEKNKTEEEKAAGQDASAEENGDLPGNEKLSEGKGDPHEEDLPGRNENLLGNGQSPEESGTSSEEEPVPAGEVDARISSYVKEHIRNDGRRRKLSAFRVLFFAVLITIVIFFFVDYVLMKRQIVNGWFAQSSQTGEDESGEETSGDGESGNDLTEEDQTEPTAGQAADDATDPDGEGDGENQGTGTGEAQGNAGTDENNDGEKSDLGESNAGNGTNSGGNQSEAGSEESETTASPEEIAVQYLVSIEVTTPENVASTQANDPQADDIGADDMGADNAEDTHKTAGVIVEIGQSAIRILTDYVSVEYAETIEITLNGGATVPAQVETANSGTGLALLIVSVADLSNDTLKEIRMATWGDTAEITVGTTLLLATAANLGETTILAVGEKKQPDTVFTTYSFLAEAEGCRILIDENGDIVAISTGVADSMGKDTEGIETAVAYCADDLRGYIEKMVDGEEIPYVGITGVTVTDEIKESVSLDMPYGIYVWLADTGSPAYQAGILNGDIITAVNGVGISTLQEMRDAILELEVGVEASFTLMRQGGSTYREYTIEVTPEAVETVLIPEMTN